MAQQVDPKAQQNAAANRVYEDFQPPHDWAHDQGSDTLILPLEGQLYLTSPTSIIYLY